MSKLKVRLKRSSVLALALALVWMFLLPMQAFAEENGGSDPALVSTEGGGSAADTGNTGTVQNENSDSSKTASTGAAYLAPGISAAAGESGGTGEGQPGEGQPGEGQPLDRFTDFLLRISS